MASRTDGKRSASRRRGSAKARRPGAAPAGGSASQGTAEAAAEQGPAVGDELGGRYRFRLEKRLGRGGFGSVFLARCLDAAKGDPKAPPRDVALKVLSKPHGDSLQFLKRELAALLAIDCSRIPKLYDWRVDGECAFVAVQYYERGSLADVRPSMDRLTTREVWRLLHDLLSALDHAHRASVLHLDIKPSNVLVDHENRFVLTDFGVAQGSRMSLGLMARGRLPYAVGTHGYRAPEQANRKLDAFDIRTDLWGVGATAWSAFTGIDLTKRRDVLRHKDAGYVYGLKPLSEVRLHCPRELEEVVMSMLAIDPADRPGGAREVLARVEAAIEGSDVDSAAEPERIRLDSDETEKLLDALVDPLWSSIFRSGETTWPLVRFGDGEVLATAGERAYRTYLLLKGRVRVELDGELVAIDQREGTFLLAISTLTGAAASATLRAEGDVFACAFNEAQLERFVTCNPAVAVRLLRRMARRLADAPPRHRAQD